jgi:hypothetical protein
LALKTPKVTLYVRDVKTFEELREKVVLLWFKQYGESLSYSDAVIKSMHLSIKYLTEKIELEANTTISDFFCRTRR